MTQDEFDQLATGDVVQGELGIAYVVTGHYGTHVVAVRTVSLMQPDEWSVVCKTHPALWHPGRP